jgi:hypothetical protein
MLILLLLSLCAGPGRLVESVVPSLAYSRACTTTIELTNLGDRFVGGVVEPHRESGALVPLSEQPGMTFHLAPGEKKNLTLRIPEITDRAWVAVREFVPDPQLSSVVSVSGTTSCVSNNQLRSALREVAHPSSNPWFEGDVSLLPGAQLAVVNTSESTAVVTGCYSGGAFVANPNVPGGAALRPLCSHQFREQIPPFGARQFPVQLGSNSHFSLHTAGRGIALQMLRLLDAGTQLYQVDSSITFGAADR